MNAVKNENGVVMVEFALVLVPLLLVLVGMLQFGVVLNAKIDETHLTSSGARYTAVNQNPGAGDGLSLQDYLKARADTENLRTLASVCVEYPVNSETGTSGEIGDPVRVTMSYPYDLVPLLGGATLSIIGDATMRLEAVPDDISEGCSS